MARLYLLLSRSAGQAGRTLFYGKEDRTARYFAEDYIAAEGKRMIRTACRWLKCSTEDFDSLAYHFAEFLKDARDLKAEEMREAYRDEFLASLEPPEDDDAYLTYVEPTDEEVEAALSGDSDYEDIPRQAWAYLDIERLKDKFFDRQSKRVPPLGRAVSVFQYYWEINQFENSEESELVDCLLDKEDADRFYGSRLIWAFAFLAAEFSKSFEARKVSLKYERRSLSDLGRQINLLRVRNLRRYPRQKALYIDLSRSLGRIVSDPDHDGRRLRYESLLWESIMSIGKEFRGGAGDIRRAREDLAALFESGEHKQAINRAFRGFLTDDFVDYALWLIDRQIPEISDKDLARIPDRIPF